MNRRTLSLCIISFLALILFSLMLGCVIPIPSDSGILIIATMNASQLGSFFSTLKLGLEGVYVTLLVLSALYTILRIIEKKYHFRKRPEFYTDFE